jgi:23S rRNA pseudouridine2605 synthase/23S rRNA pseudouridine2604 synthase
MEERVRIQKYLSMSGICSRRKAEEYIDKWLISVNWEIAQIGQSIIVWKDDVKLLDKAVKEQKEMLYYKVNKPRWIVTTCATREERWILDIIDIKSRVFPIGRLDKETTWLLLLTNDGRLANFLMHPKYNHEKEYIVEVFW